MKLVFAGTPQFAATALAALLAAGHEIVLALTQPDRPSGRGLQAKQSAVKSIALAHGLPIFQPETLKDAAVVARIAAAEPELLVVAAYGLILPQNVLDIAPCGALNIHASLLPRWRGAAPVQRAILAGDSETGVCIMQMDAGLDTGAVLKRQSLPILTDDTAGALLERLTAMGARLIVEVVAAVDVSGKDSVVAVVQPTEGVTYAAKIQKHEARLDWTEPAQLVARKIRAFNPAPGAVTRIKGADVKIWRALPCEGTGVAGEILSLGNGAVRVACGQGALQLFELQRAGGKRQLADEFVRGIALQGGDRFEAPSPG
jgi:methionyl-tRNA formyltransferase